MSETISLRLSREVLRELEGLAEEERVDRSALIRQLLDQAMQEKRIDLAVEKYRRGQASAGKAASLAGVSLWRFFDLLRERGVLLRYPQRHAEEDLRALRGE
jgi:predicted HTH domain antitoxin